MKKIIIGIFALVLCFTVVGCGNKGKGQLLINCDSEEMTVDVKKNGSFECKLLGKTYKFEITKITDKKITIETSEYGLAQASDEGSIDLLAKEKEFTITDGKETIIEPQATDVFSMLIINWKK